MRKLIVATKNRGKLREIEEILAGLSYEVLSMGDAGFHFEIEENGSTFEENALIKARTVATATGEMAMGDDSGLEVDFLDGAPGIYSARFGGAGATDMDKIKKLLGLLEGVPFEKRTARFVCAAAVAGPDGTEFVVRGTCEGYIAPEPAGDNGFGYDPIFFLPEYGKTIAQISAEEKNKISHRGKALRLMCEKLRDRKEKL